MSKVYYASEAEEEVGRSKDFEVGRIVSLKKWQEIKRNGENNYSRNSYCGFCFVAVNKGYEIRPISGRKHSCRELCPANKICVELLNEENISPRKIIKMIRALRIKKGK